MNRQQQLALGSGFGDQCFTADIDDDEIDALNDETFGAEGELGDEWEMDKMAEQTESATVEVSYRRQERNAEELLEESLSQLVDDDDDDPMSIGLKKPKQQTNSFNGNFNQTQFVKTNFANLWSPMQDDIWGFGDTPKATEDVPNRQTQINGDSHSPQKPHVIPTVPKEIGTQSLNMLLSAMKFNEKVVAPPVAPMGLKGAKTMEELEAELKLIQAGPEAEPPNPNRQVQVPTCEDIEKELKNAHMNSSAKTTAPPMPFPPMGFGMPPPTGMPPGFPPIPHLLPPAAIPPSLMANPQFRAALMTELVRRQMAMRSGGPLPPVLPPPPFPGSPNGPPGMRFPPPMSDPSHLPPFLRQQMMQNAQRQNNLRGRRLQFPDRHNQSDSHHRNSRDPYAGFMSKREKEWLIKLQMLQLTINNPFVDDYYATLFEAKKLAKQADGTGDSVAAVREKDKDENDNNSHAYVPPTFEGSLGKVQYLSANCPRQLIDVSSSVPSTTSDESPTPSTSDSKTPPIGVLNAHSNFKRHREVLMEIENLYNVMLDLEDLQRHIATASRENSEETDVAEKEKEKRCKQKQMEMAFTSDRLATLLVVKKGRTLFARFLKQADSDQVVSLLKTLIGQMPPIVMKERNTELYDIVYESLAHAVGKLDGPELSAIADTLDISLADVILKSKFMYSLWLLIVHRSASVSGFTGNLWKEKVQLWALLAAECKKFRVSDWLSDSDQLILTGNLHLCEVEMATVNKLLRPNAE